MRSGCLPATRLCSMCPMLSNLSLFRNPYRKIIFQEGFDKLITYMHNSLTVSVVLFFLVMDTAVTPRQPQNPVMPHVIFLK